MDLPVVHQLGYNVTITRWTRAQFQFWVEEVIRVLNEYKAEGRTGFHISNIIQMPDYLVWPHRGDYFEKYFNKLRENGEQYSDLIPIDIWIDFYTNCESFITEPFKGEEGYATATTP